MKSRFLRIRQDAGLTQAQFANKIGVSKNYVWMFENGERIPGDRTIADICRIFDIQELWLREGIEPMRAARSREEEIAELVTSALTGSADFKQAVIQMICSRTDEELKVLEKALMDIAERMKKE